MTSTTGAQAVALTILDLARARRFADIRDRFAPSLQPMVTADVLKAAWDAEVAQLGPVRTVGIPASEPAEQDTVVTVPVHFDRGELTLRVSLTTTGELTGLQLLPADGSEPPVPWEPPPYADPDRFDEQDVTLGDGPLAVPGTLTLPKTTSPLPALVLLGGSGPVDRDTTIGKSKPLKDLAWGLASQGIAVLRFAKITHAHPEQVKANRDFTVADEYLPHALAAIGLLREHSAIAPERILAPRGSQPRRHHRPPNRHRRPIRRRAHHPRRRHRAAAMGPPCARSATSPPSTSPRPPPSNPRSTP